MWSPTWPFFTEQYLKNLKIRPLEPSSTRAMKGGFWAMLGRASKKNKVLWSGIGLKHSKTCSIWLELKYLPTLWPENGFGVTYGAQNDSVPHFGAPKSDHQDTVRYHWDFVLKTKNPVHLPTLRGWFGATTCRRVINSTIFCIYVPRNVVSTHC